MQRVYDDRLPIRSVQIHYKSKTELSKGATATDDEIRGFSHTIHIYIIISQITLSVTSSTSLILKLTYERVQVKLHWFPSVLTAYGLVTPITVPSNFVSTHQSCYPQHCMHVKRGSQRRVSATPWMCSTVDVSERSCNCRGKIVSPTRSWWQDRGCKPYPR